MHCSGRMLLALYANGMLRLWNMLDARCIFKKKVGLINEEESESEEEDEDDDNGKEVEVQILEYIKQNQRAELVRWEPSEGNVYAILFSRLLEVFSVEDDEPMH